MHRTTWPDFAGGWLGSEKCFFLCKKDGIEEVNIPRRKGEQRRNFEECREKRAIFFKLGSQFGIEIAHG